MGNKLKIVAAVTLLYASVRADGSLELGGAEHDFGQLVNNSTVAHTVWIRAAGSDTLILTDVKTGCGCVSTPWSKSTILPGDSIALTFYWQTRGSVGRPEVSAYLYLEPENFPREVRLSGNVVTPNDTAASVDWRPSIVRLAGDSDTGLRASFELINRTDKPLTPTVVESSPGLTIELPESVAPGKTAAGRIKLEHWSAGATFEGSVTLLLSGNQDDEIRVSIPVQYGDFSFRPRFTTKKK